MKAVAQRIEIIDERLAEAATAREFLLALFEHRKKTTRGVSLAWVVKRAGIASRGYLSDVMRGRRVLHPKYETPLLEALGAGDGVKELASALLAHERAEKPAERRRLAEAVFEARATLKMEVANKPLPEKPPNIFTFELASTFQLLGPRFTRKDLERRFPKDRHAEIAEALVYMERIGHLKKSVACVYQTPKSLLVYPVHLDPEFSEQCLRYAMGQSARHVRRWVGRRDEAHFQAMIIPAERAAMQRHLPKIRKLLGQINALIKSETPDCLVRVGFNAFPLSEPAPE